MVCERAAWVGIGIVSVALACGGNWDTVSYTDEGDLCFEQKGGSVTVVVAAPDCLSSSCSRDLDGSCTVSVEGKTILLTAEISWENKHGPLARCTEDCGTPSIDCDLGALAGGDYTVEYGEDEVPLAVPVDSLCVR